MEPVQYVTLNPTMQSRLGRGRQFDHLDLLFAPQQLHCTLACGRLTNGRELTSYMTEVSSRTEPCRQCPAFYYLATSHPLHCLVPLPRRPFKGKWTCGLPEILQSNRAPEEKCVVYSFGSHNEASFERQVGNLTQDTCEVSALVSAVFFPPLNLELTLQL